MNQKINLADLMKDAGIGPATTKPRIPKVKGKNLQRVISARLVASEYLRNGLNLTQAYEDVTKKKYTAARFNAMLSADTAFLDEINLALNSADIEKNRVLTMLWAMASISPLDFMDDNGFTLSIAELKKLPREVQAMIEEVHVVNKQEPVKDQDGKVMCDPNGVPLLTNTQMVTVKVVKQKKDALAIIAQIGKLIGPQVIQGNTINVYNVGQAMAEADDKRIKALEGRTIDSTALRLDHDPT